ncbi:hypothetical protein CLD22_28615, partial [Rubrivivax gelatinosus]|nr:hypothetical protein [Rubrivivax gelatinosus]
DGSDGSNGSDGADGTDGSDGLTTLVRLQTEAAGAHCAQGGTQVLAGADGDADGYLDDAEVTSTAYVCGGAPGSTGATGATGATGSTGADGANGHSSLLTFASEAAGSLCAYGGQKIQTGVDLDDDGVLDAAEVTSTAYVCSAAPADTNWIELTSGPVQAAANTGYLANSSSDITITLPPAPEVGDWVKVTGVGSGGWTIAQNAGQRISTLGLPGGLALSWTATGVSGNWAGAASSSDGSRRVAVSSLGALYTTNDGGDSWIL